MGGNLPKEVNNWVRNVFWDCFLLRQHIPTHKWRGICWALYIWEGEKCVTKIFLNLSKYSFPKSESARTWENLGSFSFPNALILTLEATFSFGEIKRRDGGFHNEWPLVSFCLGGGYKCGFFWHGPVWSAQRRSLLWLQLSDKGNRVTDCEEHRGGESLWLESRSSCAPCCVLFRGEGQTVYIGNPECLHDHFVNLPSMFS